MPDPVTREEFDALEARVTALEEGGTPPEPEQPPDSTGGVEAMRIADVIERFGINSFSSLNDGNMWGSWPADYRPDQVIQSLRYLTADSGHQLGLREYHYNGRQDMQRPWLEQIRAAFPAMRVTMCVGANGSTNDVDSMLSMTDLLTYVEGLNEGNTNFGSGEVDPNVQLEIQKQLSAKAGPSLKVMGPSVVGGMPNPAGWVEGYCGATLPQLNQNLEAGNAHYYPPSDPDTQGQGTSINEYCESLAGAYDTSVIHVTEFHPTLYNSEGNGPKQQGWNGQRDAYYTLMALLRCAEAERSAQTEIGLLVWYALYDYGETYECGLFPTNAQNPRPAAEAIRRLCQTCPDTGQNRRSFTPGSLDYTVEGDCNHLLAEASDGTFFLFLWRAGKDHGGAPIPIRVNFEGQTSVHEVDLVTGAEYRETHQHYPVDLNHTVVVLVI